MPAKKYTIVILLFLAISAVFSSITAVKGGSTLPDSGDNDEATVTLANYGQAKYKVYVHTAADAIERHSAQELADYLGQVSGASFELVAGVSPPNGHTIAVGRNALTESLVPELSTGQLGDDGFVLRAINRYIVIAGGSLRGTMNGVNYFLDRYVGVKWFSPTYTFVPAKMKLQVALGSDMQVPRFQYREMFVNDGDDEQFRARNLLNGKSHYRTRVQSEPGLNSWSDYVPPGVHNFKSIVTDTVYHSGGQLLAMNEEVRRIAAESLIGKIGQRMASGLDPSYGFSQQDTAWTPDPQSKAFADQHGGTLAAPVMDMISDVANRVKAQIPDARIGTLAYQFSFPAPAGLTLPDNVVVTLAPFEKDHGRSLGSAQNAWFGEQIAAWAGMSDHLVLWDYLTNFNGGGYLQPYPNLYAMADTIKFSAQYPAIKGYFGQQVHDYRGPIGTGFDDLRTWLGARLLWDPDQDVQALIDEFVDGYYGAAAPYIGDYIELMHQSLADSGSSLMIGTPITASYLSFDTMRQADLLFNQAVAAVAHDPVFFEHVQKMRLNVDYIILARRAEFIQQAQHQQTVWNPDMESRMQRFKDYSQNIERYRIDNGLMPILYEQLALERVAASVPDPVANLPASDWTDMQDMVFRLFAGAEIVTDAKASDHAAAKLGKTDAWGIQVDSQALPREGRWKLYANVRIDPSSGIASGPALRYGLYPSEYSPGAVGIETLSDGEYHVIELPWAFEYDPQTPLRYLWFQPRLIEALYVDRVFAVRVNPPQIYNAGFETAAPNGAYPDGWQMRAGVWDSGEAYEGSRSIRLDSDPANNFHVVHSDASKFISVTPGQTYKLTGWIKNGSNTGSVSLGARQINASNGSISYAWHPGASPGSGWTQYEVAFTAAPNARYVSIYFKSDQQTDGPAWLDNVELTELP